MIALDPRSFLYRDSLDPDAAKALTADALAKADDGELYLQYRKAEAFGFDDGRLKTASYDTNAGFGLRAVSGEMTAFAHANELSEAAIKRAAETMALIDPSASGKAQPPRSTNRHLYTDADPLDLVPFAEKVNLCQTIDAAARARDPRVAQVSVGLSGTWSVVEIVRADGFVATDGWAEVSSVQAVDLARRFEADGVSAIVYTDIAKDGMMQGCNVEATAALAAASKIPVIASGGIHNLGDIEKLLLARSPGIIGAITGRAIYEGTLDVAEAQSFCDSFKG